MTNPSCLLLYPQGEDTRPGTQQRPDSSFWKEREANPKTLARLMLCGPWGSQQRGQSQLVSPSNIEPDANLIRQLAKSTDGNKQL